MHYAATVFDFDGVIIKESERVVKEQAWEGVAQEFGFGEAGRAERLAAQSRWAKGRGTRVDILRDVFIFLGRSDGELLRLVDAAGSRFNELVQDGIAAVGVDPADRRALEALAAKLPLYINTGTPEDAIQETIERLSLVPLFRGVYGMPTSKLVNLKRVCLELGCESKDICFVGDGDHDAAAALEFGCDFIGRANLHNQWQPPKDFTLVHSLQELLPLVSP